MTAGTLSGLPSINAMSVAERPAGETASVPNSGKYYSGSNGGTKMDVSQSLLFGEFPRSIGVTTPGHSGMELRQYLVHSEAEFDAVLDKVGGERNVYSSISAFTPVMNEELEGCKVVIDKVAYDFDSSAKAGPNSEIRWSHSLIPDNAKDKDVIEHMREDKDILHAVLGDVCDDVQRLTDRCREEEIPHMAVFSGLGIHFYQFFEQTARRSESRMGSTSRKYITELNLATVDEKATGKPYRILRVPNLQRVDGTEETGIYPVPLTPAECREIAPEDLLDVSVSPRPKVGQEPTERPEMKLYQDYAGPTFEEGLGQEKMRPIPQEGDADSLAEVLVKEITKMPCVYERALSRNPDHTVRVKLGIMFLNAGYSPEEAADIFSRLGWVDWNREKTLANLRSLRKGGKGDYSCKTMQAKGLCTRADDKHECPTYGYQGGNQPWK